MDRDLELRVAWQRWVAPPPTDRSDAEAAFAAVVGRYRAPDRQYHDVRHLRWVVRHVDELATRTPPDDPGAVVAAAFHHDAVYDVDRHDNEARSAELAVRSLTSLGWAPDRCERVAAMIRATAHLDAASDTAPDDTGTAVLLAADLAVLAADPAGYGDYVRAVRREYRHLTDAEWRAGRAAVVATFLARSAIFPPGLDLGHWEQRARANLTAEAATLR